jgi:S1-C subfamily serine protease
MADPATSPAFSRVCPACGRRVPTRVAACRCGQTLDDAPEHADGAAAAAPRRERSPIGIVATSVVVAAVTAATVFYSMKQPPAVSDEAVAVVTARPAASVPPPAPATPADDAPAPVPQASAPASVVEAPTGAAALTPPSARPESLEDVIGRAMPAVVRVETSGGFGSGFFVAPDTILTNVHVVGSNSSVTIRRPDGTTVPARVDTTAPELDIAVVHIINPLPNQPTLNMGSGMQAQPGQELVALGTPLGLQNTVTRGIVSAVRGVNGVTLVQTDAAINPGNSGGPLIDRSGNVIGIATMGTRADVGQGVSFGIAIDHARDLLAGRRSTATGTPTANLNQAMSGRPALSERDAAREESTRAYEKTIAAAAEHADALDARWRSFVSACYEGRVAGSFDRQWFAFWEPRSMQGAVSPGCGPAFSELRRMADDIRTAVRTAEESARQAGVYPGPRRDILKRYRLEYPGWER